MIFTAKVLTPCGHPGPPHAGQDKWLTGFSSWVVGSNLAPECPCPTHLGSVFPEAGPAKIQLLVLRPWSGCWAKGLETQDTREHRSSPNSPSVSTRGPRRDLCGCPTSPAPATRKLLRLEFSGFPTVNAPPIPPPPPLPSSYEHTDRRWTAGRRNENQCLPAWQPQRAGDKYRGSGVSRFALNEG